MLRRPIVLRSRAIPGRVPRTQRVHQLVIVRRTLTQTGATRKDVTNHKWRLGGKIQRALRVLSEPLLRRRFQRAFHVSQVLSGGQLVVKRAQDAALGVDHVSDAQGMIQDRNQRAVGFDDATLGIGD